MPHSSLFLFGFASSTPVPIIAWNVLTACALTSMVTKLINFYRIIMNYRPYYQLIFLKCFAEILLSNTVLTRTFVIRSLLICLHCNSTFDLCFMLILHYIIFFALRVLFHETWCHKKCTWTLFFLTIIKFLSLKTTCTLQLNFSPFLMRT